MTQSVYSHIAQAWRNQDSSLAKERMIEWRRSPVAVVVERPLRLDRARSLGYKAKKGFVVVRMRLLRGGRKRERRGVKGRKSRKTYHRKILKMSYQWIAEIRASRKFPNLEVLNSYPIGKDGKHAFYEVILIDASRPEIKADKVYSWIGHGKNSKRADRGLTSAGRRSRGLLRRGHYKVRPSVRAWNRKGK